MPPTQIPQRLASQRRQLPKPRRELISKAIAQYLQLATHECEVVYPKADDPPVDSLPIWHNGLRCTWRRDDQTQCPYVCRSLPKMKEHCKSAHHWANVQRQGGDARRKQKNSPNNLWQSDSTCQQFFRAIGWKRLFEVGQHLHQASQIQPVCKYDTDSFFR